MNNKRHLRLVRTTKQALSLTSRQRAWRQNQPDNKTMLKKTNDKTNNEESSC